MSEIEPLDAAQPDRNTASTADRLNIAIGFHRIGDFLRAEQVYREIIAGAASHVDALHLLGVVLIQTGRLENGVELIDRALAINSNHAEALSNRGNALIELKRLDEAVASYDRALAIRPEYADAHNNRGVALKELGRLDEAVASYDRALAIRQDYAEAYRNRGAALLEMKRFGEALASYDRALALTPNDAEALCKRGVALGALKRFGEALASYDRALAIRPDYAEALGRRGNTLVDLRRLDEALASYDSALALNPDYPEALSNRGNALMELKRLDEAVASYDRALAVRPEYAHALINRGAALAELKRFDEAVASYDRALAIRPDYPEALSNRGVALSALKRFDEAVASYDRALALRPDYPEALSNRGLALFELKRFEEAFASYDRALAVRPDYPEALGNRGIALSALKRFEEALAGYDRALAIRPDYVEALNNRGNALIGLKRLDEALASYDRALALNPNYADAHCNRGATLVELGRIEEALASYDRALAIRPDYAEVFYNRAIALIELKRLDEALANFGRALAIRPGYGDALFGAGLASLRLGDFSSGWTGYEYRWRSKETPARKLKGEYPVWKGDSLSGKRLIVYEEQGLGDVIQFSRYLNKLSELGAQVTFLVRAELHRLLQTLDHPVRLLAAEPSGESFDYECALLSLPLVFGATLETIPAAIPYLKAEPERIRKWKQRIGEQGFKIGVAWQGNKAVKIDSGRSFPLREFLGVSRLPHVRLISLQKGEGAEQLRDLPEGMAVETLGADYDSGGAAFLDTAAVMEALDLVISSDTSVAHVAGALGRPVWVALKYVPDWRWMLDRTDSQWYPTMRLFRQRTRDDWKGVFLQIEYALREFVSDRVPRATERGHDASTPMAPISWGELIDKITILEIKSVEMASETARANVMKELLLLQEVSGAQRACEQLSDLKGELKAVNVALWKIEDAIREKDGKKEFDEEFIELARSVYRRNDERAAIKRRINTVLGSAIIEEKSYKEY